MNNLQEGLLIIFKKDYEVSYFNDPFSSLLAQALNLKPDDLGRKSKENITKIKIIQEFNPKQDDDKQDGSLLSIEDLVGTGDLETRMFRVVSGKP